MKQGKQTSQQNRTRDVEIKNKLTVIRGEGGIMGERRGRVKSRNMYEGTMEKDNRGGIECGGWLVQGRVMGRKWEQL